jgi:hypothetical protein
VSGILAKIKAFFASPSPAPPAPVADVVPAPVAATTETPLAENPAAVAQEPPPVVAERSDAVAERPAEVPDRPAVVPERPAVVPERPAAVAEPPAPLEEPVADLEPAPADGLTLRLESERATQSTFHVTKSGATIGRGPESTIQLADLSVSRKHARITFKQGAYWLSDLGSMGGTWIDGAKLAAPRRVATGQTIDIGLCRLVVVAAAEGETAGAAKGPSNAA